MSDFAAHTDKPTAPPPPPGIYPELVPDMQPPPPYSMSVPQVQPMQQAPPPPQAKVIIPIHYGANPMSLECPSCHENVITSTETMSGKLTLIAAGALAAAGCIFCFPCIGLIPFCVPPCKDVKHTCPKCHAQLGIFRRM